MLLMGILPDLEQFWLEFIMKLNIAIYNLVSYCYQIFIALAEARIFDSESPWYNALMIRIYAVIGIIALFIISYNLLMAIIDPDKAAKSDTAASKIVPKVIAVILLLALTPTIFNFAYKVQNVILNNNMLGRFILGTADTGWNNTGGTASMIEGDDNLNFKLAGLQVANDIFVSFMKVKPIELLSDDDLKEELGDVTLENLEAYCQNNTISSSTYCFNLVKTEITDLTLARKVLTEQGWDMTNETFIGKFNNWNIKNTLNRLRSWGYNDNVLIQKKSLQEVYQAIGSGQVDFDTYVYFAAKAKSDSVINYNWFVQGICGLFLVYVFISFCIDNGLRVVKMAYYELIAPIPIASLLLPGKSEVFTKWWKSALSTFALVFLDLIAVFFGILLINNLPKPSDSLWGTSTITADPGVQTFVWIFIVIGILIFVKQAPKLIADMFGLKEGTFKLGIKDKLTGMAFVGGAVDKAHGAVSGALGAGYSALTNKGNVGKAMKSGLFNGWKSGGRQFGAQRDAIYSAMGKVGKQGAFGGRAFSDRWADESKDRFKDDYRDNHMMQNFLAYEQKHKNNVIYQNAYSKKKKELLDNIATVENNFNSGRAARKQTWDNQKAAAMRGFDAAYDNAKNNFEMQKNANIANLTASLNNARKNPSGMRNEFGKSSLEIELEQKLSAAKAASFENSASYKNFMANKAEIEQKYSDSAFAAAENNLRNKALAESITQGKPVKIDYDEAGNELYTVFDYDKESGKLKKMKLSRDDYIDYTATNAARKDYADHNNTFSDEWTNIKNMLKSEEIKAARRDMSAEDLAHFQEMGKASAEWTSKNAKSEPKSDGGDKK